MGNRKKNTKRKSKKKEAIQKENLTTINESQYSIFRTINNKLQELAQNAVDESDKHDKFFVKKVLFTSLIMFISIILAVATRLIVGDKNMIFVSIVLIFFYYMYEYLKQKTTENFVMNASNAIALCALYQMILSINPLKMPQLSSDYGITNILYLYLSFFIITILLGFHKRLINIVNGFTEYLNLTKSIIGTAKTILLSYALMLPSMFLVICYAKYEGNNSKDLNILAIMMATVFLSMYIGPCIALINLMVRVILKIIKVENNTKDWLITKINKSKVCLDAIENVIYNVTPIRKNKSNEDELIEKDPSKLFNIFDSFINIFIRYAMLLSFFVYYFSMTNYYYFYTEKNNGYCENTNLNNDDLIFKLNDDNVYKLIYNGSEMKSFKPEKCNRVLNELKYNK